MLSGSSMHARFGGASSAQATVIVACIFMAVAVLLTGLPVIHLVTGLASTGAPGHGANVHAYKVFHHSGSLARVGVLGTVGGALIAVVLVLRLAAEGTGRAARTVRGRMRLMLMRGAGARSSCDDHSGTSRYCLPGDQTPCSRPILGPQGVFHIHDYTTYSQEHVGRGTTWDAG